MPNAALMDGHGRRITYLRLSVTDRCDFRCVYCMDENMTFLPRNQIMSISEMESVARAFVEQGVTRIRLTGGEPLVHPEIGALVARLKRIPGLETLTLTTNGARLVRFARTLKDVGLDRLNISLDSLNPVRFRELTRTGDLGDVLTGIDAARQKNLDLAFIEEMPLGQITEHDRALCFMESAEILARISSHFPLTPCAENTGGPARYYRMNDSTSRIGVISPHSNNFCSSCNRVRVTASGRLLLCLGNENHVELRPLLNDPGELSRTITEAIKGKPERHIFSLNNEPGIVRFMNMTGG